MSNKRMMICRECFASIKECDITAGPAKVGSRTFFFIEAQCPLCNARYEAARVLTEYEMVLARAGDDGKTIKTEKGRRWT